MYKREDFNGNWNEGKSPKFGEDWILIKEPLRHVLDTNGLLAENAKGTNQIEKSIQKNNRALNANRNSEIDTENSTKGKNVA